MSDSPSFELDNPDALSSVLSQLQLTADVYSDGDFCGAWALDTSGSRRIPFHLVGKGEAWLHVEGHNARPLSSGDLVLFPRDSRHVIAATNEAPAAKLINAEQLSDSGPITNMICGIIFCHQTNRSCLHAKIDIFTHQYHSGILLLLGHMIRNIEYLMVFFGKIRKDILQILIQCS